MKYLKFQQDLIKAAGDRDGWKHKPFNFPWFQTKNEVGVCPSANYVVLIPNDQLYIDVTKVFKSTTINPTTILAQDNLKEAVDTKTSVEINNVHNKSKSVLRKFLVGDETVFLDERYLKYFDLEESTFKGSNRKSPIYVYEYGDVLVGLILPVNHTEKESN